MVRKLLFAIAFLLLAQMAHAVVITNNMALGEGNLTTTPMLWVLNDNMTLAQVASDAGHSVNFGGPTAINIMVSLPAPSAASTACPYLAQSINQSYDFNASGVVFGLAQIRHVWLREKNMGITVDIQTDNANKPSGTLVNANATIHLNASQLYSTYYGGNIYTLGTSAFIFPSAIPLTNNTRYWFVIKPDGAYYSYNYYVTAANTAYDRYTSGSYSTSDAAHTTWTTAATGDLWFYVLTPGKNSSSMTWNAGNSTAVLGDNWKLEVDGTANLNIQAGELLTAGAMTTQAPMVRVGWYGGGLITLKGNATAYASILAPTTNNFAALGNYYVGKISGDYANLTSAGSGGTYYGYGLYGGVSFRNCIINNTYNNNAGYSVAIYATRRSMFNNCTFQRASAYYSIYLMPYAPSDVVFVNNRIVNPAYAYAISNYNTDAGGPKFIDNLYNGIPLVPGNITMGYSGSGTFYWGHVVAPRVLVNGSPVANATILVTSQFGANDNIQAQYNYGYNDSTTSLNSLEIPAVPTSTLITPQATTNAQGYPRDELGLNTTWMIDSVYGLSGAPYTTAILRVYFGGNATGIRPLGYIWKNDGTDYGYIISVTDGTRSKTLILNPNAAYSSDVELVTTMNLTKNMTSSSFNNLTASNGCQANLTITVANASQSYTHTCSAAGTNDTNTTYDFCQVSCATTGMNACTYNPYHIGLNASLVNTTYPCDLSVTGTANNVTNTTIGGVVISPTCDATQCGTAASEETMLIGLLLVGVVALAIGRSKRGRQVSEKQDNELQEN